MSRIQGSVGKIYISAEKIEAEVKRLANEITNDYKDLKEDIIIIVLMNGGVIFACDLVKQIKLPLIMDFMRAKSYGDEFVSSHDVKILKDISEDIYNKHVIIVEDIIDTGYTLNKVTKMLNIRKPLSIKICTMFDKNVEREKKIIPDYIGMKIENKFILGYGLDYKQKYRNLPHVEIMES